MLQSCPNRVKAAQIASKLPKLFQSCSNCCAFRGSIPRASIVSDRRMHSGFQLRSGVNSGVLTECDTGQLGWAVTAQVGWKEEEEEEEESEARPSTLATAFLRCDGHAYQGEAGGVVVARGWQAKGQPARTVHWYYPEDKSWLAGGFPTGNGLPQLPAVRVTRARETAGGRERETETILLPDASLFHIPLGTPPASFSPSLLFFLLSLGGGGSKLRARPQLLSSGVPAKNLGGGRGRGELCGVRGVPACGGWDVRTRPGHVTC
eukprot:1218389-Rhodomonas_salina.1